MFLIARAGNVGRVVAKQKSPELISFVDKWNKLLLTIFWHVINRHEIVVFSKIDCLVRVLLVA